MLYVWQNFTNIEGILIGTREIERDRVSDRERERDRE